MSPTIWNTLGIGAVYWRSTETTLYPFNVKLKLVLFIVNWFRYRRVPCRLIFFYRLDSNCQGLRTNLRLFRPFQRCGTSHQLEATCMQTLLDSIIPWPFDNICPKVRLEMVLYIVGILNIPVYSFVFGEFSHFIMFG